jgi:hypothetical protein
MLSAWKTGGSDHAGADPLRQANERRAERLGAGTEREQVSDQIYYARKLKTMILYMPACHLANGEFSCNFPFVDRSTIVSSHLAGAHVRIGSADPAEGFPSGTRFSAPLILANPGNQASQATVSVDYTINSVPHRIQVAVASLSAGQTKQFDLSQALAVRGISGPLDDAGVDVSYTGPPGTVIGRLSSVDQTGDFAFDVPIKDPLAGMMRVSGVYPWRLDDRFTSVVHLKNTVNSRVHAWCRSDTMEALTISIASRLRPSRR